MKINKNTKLLIISPHPDDEALGCGGIIGKCKKEKAKISIMYISVGNNRQLVTGRTKLSKRLEEIKNVEKLINIKANVLFTADEFCKLDVIPQQNIINPIEDEIQRFKPDIIAIPQEGSYNQDHRAVFDASITALRPIPRNIRHMPDFIIQYYEPYLWSNSQVKAPNYYLNLDEKYGSGSLLDFKIKLLKCHKTQVRSDPFPRSENNLRSLSRVYGKEIGIFNAEPFYLMRGIIC